MNATTREESAGPLGVIGCLAAGFEVLSRNLWLMVLPVLLDLLLWLGPQLSIAPLLQRFNAFLVAQPTPDPATARQVEQAVQMLGPFGEQFDLLSLLSTLPLLNVPTLLARHAPGTVLPLSEPRVLLVTSALALVGWGILLLLVGLVLGFLYLNSLAHQVSLMCSPDEQESGEAEGPALSGVEGPALSGVEGAEQIVGVSSGALSRELQLSSTEVLSRAVGKLIRVFLFAAGLLMNGMVFASLWMLVVGVLLTIAQPLGLLVWALGIGLGGYVALHLLFVVPGVVLGGRGLLRAIWESIVLIHTQFPSVVGLLVLVIVIYEGLGYVWSLPSGDSWLLLIGILGNGCIATGLTAATFVFYQERLAGSGKQGAAG